MTVRTILETAFVVGMFLAADRTFIWWGNRERRS